jgi:glycine/D-amino acid oxidase-like deaminating enzyme
MTTHFFSERTPLPAKWDRTADVVVIGYGGAGAVAAITAYDTGSDVLVIQDPTTGGILVVRLLGTSSTSWHTQGSHPLHWRIRTRRGNEAEPSEAISHSLF